MLVPGLNSPCGLGRNSLASSIGHRSRGSLHSPRLSVGGPVGQAVLTDSANATQRFPMQQRPRSVTLLGGSSPSASPVPTLTLPTTGTRPWEPADDEIDKENANARMIQFAPRSPFKMHDFAMNTKVSAVLGSIDNTQLYRNTPGLSTLKSDLMSGPMPTAWAWEQKWAWSSDLEEDEMHSQLWQRYPDAAHRFKQLAAGKYIFDGRKVELKILYGQLYVTTVDDGQVAACQDFLRAHPTLTSTVPCAGSEKRPKDSLVASTADSASSTHLGGVSTAASGSASVTTSAGCSMEVAPARRGLASMGCSIEVPPARRGVASAGCRMELAPGGQSVNGDNMEIFPQGSGRSMELLRQSPIGRSMELPPAGAGRISGKARYEGSSLAPPQTLTSAGSLASQARCLGVQQTRGRSTPNSTAWRAPSPRSRGGSSRMAERRPFSARGNAVTSW